MKYPDTIMHEDQEDENIYDLEFMEQEFINELTEWRTYGDESSDYCSRN